MLTQAQISDFHETGYLVVPGLVPDALCDPVIDAILDYAGVDLAAPDTWYNTMFEGHGIVPLHHHQALWDVRQYPPIHGVFADLYGTPNLWVSNDRVSFKPPAAPQTKSWQRPPVHWDCDPWTFKGTGMQGLVYLTDTESGQGAFTCAPGTFRHLQDYLDLHADDEDRRRPRVNEEELVQIPGVKGSLVIFHRLMPHTSSLNESNSHRFVQYITMMMADESRREKTIEEWQNNLLPDWAQVQSISGGKTHEPGPRAQLTDHGRKLVGLEAW